MLKRNYDILGTISTGAVLVILSAPWTLWIVWGGVVVYQVGNRLRFRHA
ncbi:hypothetical protein [Rhodococcus sp. IEGM 1406]|nr:hypothetical protein [Rhodococcus sp. IEGM 1406]MDI9908012.1 hypothetical protein [Rhodococcus sp. IEGM 1406]